ncbi:Hsp20/alpha crystallin family protein [Fulvivirga sp. 29W222]|uniref:Hsp20/alpha crystallin family protein n=1 Tax=Fulvivirga marina TaxID=2494733 RepID=A0A937G2N6_9BACT|nr:Hsp20/alpha crystallin family protein [Fulvivirga marina]MBL6449353.1 Hsp20/alpha crystallin family protein [Fulvivirga marina]
MGLLRQRTGPFHRIGDRYATLFDSDHFLGRSAFEDSWMVKPPANVKEQGDVTIFEIAIPGFNKDEINLEVKNDALYISAKKKGDSDKANYVKKEVPTQIFSRVVDIKPNIDQSKISARLINGILRLEIPQAINGKKTKTIEVS